jgi:methylthioribose-1-phosphate isomerase
LEEKEESEVVRRGVLPSVVKVKNPYFDITPLELITGIITENGMLAAEEVIGYLKTLTVGK